MPTRSCAFFYPNIKKANVLLRPPGNTETRSPLITAERPDVKRAKYPAN